MAGTLRLQSGTAAGTPPTGTIHFYSKTDKKLYFKDDSGTEYLLTTGAGGPTDTDGLPEGVVNLYFTVERAQDAVGSALANTTTITLTYDDAGNAITADINNASIINALIDPAAAIALSKLAALTANRALISNGSGVIAVSATTATELGFVSGVTSSIQTQLGTKALSSRLINTTAPLTGGGDLSADRTLSIPAATSSVNGYLTAVDWATFNSKQSAGSYITALTGDVTASGPGSSAATVAAIQGTAISGTTGTTNVVFSASPTLTGTLTAATISASGPVTGSNLSGTNTGDQTITLIGDVTGSGTGSFTATIAANAVTNTKLAQMATHTIKGNATGSTANAADLTGTQVTALLDQFTSLLQGVVPGSGGGTSNFLRADGSWVTPPNSGGTVTSISVVTANGVSGSVANATTTPAITLTLGAITPSSVNASGTVLGSNLSGSNTGDQTITLTGDVTGSGTGSFAATVALVGGSTAANVHAAELLANAATNLNTASTIVRRDASGNFTAGTITAALSGNATTATTATNFSGSLAGDVTGTQGATVVSKIQSTTVSGTTGTGNVMFSASPTTTGTLTAAAISASGAITGSNLSGTNTGDITLTAVGSSANANGASLSGQAFTLQPATSSFPGVLLAADWTTFNSKQAAGNYITALTGDVTAAGPGSSAATIAVGAVTDTKASLANKPSSTVVAITNQALTGTPTIDGQATAVGSIILLTGQTSGSENGPWMAAAGAWSRPTWYPSGGTTQAFQFITTLIRLGSVYQGSTWRQTAAGPITIDTTATTWAVTPLASGGLNSNIIVHSFGISMDGSGSPITTGVKGYTEIPFSGTITGWTLLGDVSGSIVVDVWKAAYSSYPPTVSNTITGGTLPTISSAVKGQNLSVSGWTTSVTAGDTIGFNVNSCTGITKATLVIRINRT